MSTEATNTTAQAEKPSRDKIRAQILGTRHDVAVRSMQFFGTTIELRQPRLGEIIKAQQAQAEGADKNGPLIAMLIERAYVPGTDQRVFEDADIETLKELPFGKDFQEVNRLLIELSDVDFLDGAST